MGFLTHAAWSRWHCLDGMRLLPEATKGVRSSSLAAARGWARARPRMSFPPRPRLPRISHDREAVANEAVEEKSGEASPTIAQLSRKLYAQAF